MTPNWERTRKQNSSLGPHQGAHVTFLFGRNGLKTYLKENHYDSLYIYTVNINNPLLSSLLRNSLFKKIVGWPVGFENCVNTPITTTTSFIYLFSLLFNPQGFSYSFSVLLNIRWGCSLSSAKLYLTITTAPCWGMVIVRWLLSTMKSAFFFSSFFVPYY